MSAQINKTIRITVGIILTLLGALFLLRNFDLIDFNIPFYFFSWQGILIVVGLILLASFRNKGTGVVMILIGLIGIAPAYWPLLLVLIGLFIIFRRQNYSFYTKRRDNDNSDEHSFEINEVAIFGGGKKSFQAKVFRGGQITAIFGGSEIDLLDCELADGENILDIFAMFGGTTIFVPNNWNVEIDLIPIFGGMSDNRRKDPNIIPQERRTLRLKGLVIFGGGELRN